MTRPRRWVGLAFAALLWIGGVAGAIVYVVGQDAERGLQAPPLPETTCAGPEIGVHSTLAFEGDPERRAATVAAIHETLDAQVVRDSLLWHRIEPVEGERDWSRLDSVVEEIRAAGMEPLLAVLGSPSWANGVSESTPGHYLHVPARGPALDAWLERYAEFLAAAVERYEDVVRRWEIWNEPNLAAFWRPRPDPAAYRQVYRRLRATILSVDPGAEVAVGGLGRLTLAPEAGGPDRVGAADVSGRVFLRRLMRAGAPLDNVAVHAYTTDDHAPDVHVPGEKNFDDIERVHEQLAAAGERASIWVTEWGWSSETVGEARQARYVDRSLEMIERRYPFVTVATYFSDHDRPPDLFYGLLDQRLDPKPAARAFRAHAERLAARCRPSRNGP